MITLSRNDTSVVGRWWWTVDRWTLGAILVIMALGIMMTMAASPPAAERIGVPHYVLDYESRFRDSVIDDFVDTYLAGATPATGAITGASSAIDAAPTETIDWTPSMRPSDGA